MSKELLGSKTVFFDVSTSTPLVGISDTEAGIVGTALKGEIGKAKLITSWTEFVNEYGGFDNSTELAKYVAQFFAEGGQRIHVVRTVHYTDITNPNSITAVKATGQIDTVTSVAQPAQVVSTSNEPYHLANGDTIVISVDGGALQTATINATAGSLTTGSSEPYNLSGGEDLTVVIDGGLTQTLTINAGDITSGSATAQELANTFNSQVVGGSFYATGGNLEFISDTKGTSSSVQVTGGTANAQLNFPAGVNSGTGNVADVAGVTNAELKTIIEGAVTGVTVSSDSSNHLVIDTTATGATHTIQVDSSSTADSSIGLDNSVHTGSDVGSGAVMTTEGAYYGDYGNNVTIEVRDASDGDASHFNIWVYYNGNVVERFPNLSMDTASDNYFVTIINNGSTYINVVDLSVGTRPTNGTYTMSGGVSGLSGITDSDYIGDANAMNGMYALNDAVNLSLIAIPEMETPSVHLAMINYCDVVRDGKVFAILSVPNGYDYQGAKTYVETTAGILNMTDGAAIFYPYIKVTNPDKTVFGTSATIDISPSASYMGLMCGITANNFGGVYIPVAGKQYGVFNNVVGVVNTDVLRSEVRDVIYPVRINPITKDPSSPYYVDGARTLSENTDYPYINQKRARQHIEKELGASLDYLRHKRPGVKLRNEAYRVCYSYLKDQLKYGAFYSDNPEDSFSVDVGEGINPPSEEEAGRLNIALALRLAGSIDWIVVTITKLLTD